MKKKVAIIGRPNVGKSSLFNYILGKRIAIVEEEAGVTRDRLYGEAEWQNFKFDIIDTAGIANSGEDEISKNMQEQTDIAIEIADVIIFLTDIKNGVTEEDKEIAWKIKKSGKNVVLAVNKADKLGKDPLELYEFYNLGLGDPIRISVANKIGIGDLLSEVCKYFENIEENIQDDRIKVAFIGKPNVGKSSLINKILGENRHIVSSIAGTTRDAADSFFENKYGKYTFIDTAGLRKKAKIHENIELYSSDRTKYAIERSDVSCIVIDAVEGVTSQDAKVLGLAHEAGKGIIILVNKWDLIEKDNTTHNEFFKNVRNKLSYASYAPILFISAKTGQRIDNVFELINKVYKNNSQKISTPVINKIISEAVSIKQPPSDKGVKLKIYYGVQGGTNPPSFALFVNKKELFHYSYQRYIINTFRKYFDFEGTTIRLMIREKKEEN